MTRRVRPAASVSSVSGDGPKNPVPIDMRLVHSPDLNSADKPRTQEGPVLVVMIDPALPLIDSHGLISMSAWAKTPGIQ